jgi:CelD/BcsL family acetyltransferase involved in cellulose biosynthesis
MLEPAEFVAGVTPDTEALSSLTIAEITVYRSFEDADSVWRSFEGSALASPYQRIDWLEAWHRHVGARNRIDPLIVVARNNTGRPVLLWPLGSRRKGTARVGCWLGGKLVNYGLGLYDAAAAKTLDRDALVPVIRYLREETELEALTLGNQPEAWRGVLNPLLALPHQVSPSFAYSISLQPDFDALYTELRSNSTRKKLRRSERRMIDAFGSCDLRRPESEGDIDRVLDVFLQQKSKRMREKQQRNDFGQPGVMDFFREIGKRSLGAEEPLLDLFWLDAGGHVAATWAGTTAGGRISGIINSFNQEEEFAKHHPGDILLRHLLEHCCKRGLSEFDLGVGEAQYKDRWCPRTDPLFDSFLPLNAQGWMHTAFARTGFRLKRVAKQSKFLSEMIEKLR